MSTEHKTFGGHLIHGEFDAIFNHDIPIVLGLLNRQAKILKDGWNKLAPEVQGAFVGGSGIIDTIAKNLDALPEDVINNILAKFTTIKVEDLTAWLAKVQGVFTGVEATVDQDLATTITNLQAYFKQYENTVIGNILSIAAQILISIISPSTIPAQISTYKEIAYRVFVKGDTQ